MPLFPVSIVGSISSKIDRVLARKNRIATNAHEQLFSKMEGLKSEFAANDDIFDVLMKSNTYFRHLSVPRDILHMIAMYLRMILFGHPGTNNGTHYWAFDPLTMKLGAQSIPCSAGAVSMQSFGSELYFIQRCNLTSHGYYNILMRTNISEAHDFVANEDDGFGETFGQYSCRIASSSAPADIGIMPTLVCASGMMWAIGGHRSSTFMHVFDSEHNSWRPIPSEGVSMIPRFGENHKRNDELRLESDYALPRDKFDTGCVVILHRNVFYAFSRTRNDVWYASADLRPMKNGTKGIVWHKMENVPNTIGGFTIVMPIRNLLVAVATKPHMQNVYCYNLDTAKWELRCSIPELLVPESFTTEALQEKARTGADIIMPRQHALVVASPGDDCLYILTCYCVVRYRPVCNTYNTMSLDQITPMRIPVFRDMSDQTSASESYCGERNLYMMQDSVCNMKTNMRQVLKVDDPKMVFSRIAELQIASAHVSCDPNRYGF